MQIDRMFDIFSDFRWRTHLHHWFLRFQRTWDTVLIWCYQVGSNLKKITCSLTSQQLEGAQVKLTTCVSFTKCCNCKWVPSSWCNFSCICSQSCRQNYIFRMSKVVFYVDDNSTSKNPNLESIENTCTHIMKLSIQIAGFTETMLKNLPITAAPKVIASFWLSRVSGHRLGDAFLPRCQSQWRFFIFPEPKNVDRHPGVGCYTP